MSGAAIDIESALQTRLAEANNPSINAVLLPFSGPDYAELQANRQRWNDRQTVKPVALSIGRLTFGEGVQAELSQRLEQQEFQTIISDYFHIDDLRRQYGDQAERIALIHLQFGRLAVLDAMRRGVHNPYIDVPSLSGGKFISKSGAENPHVDAKYGSETVLRYVMTSLGLLTGFSQPEISESQVNGLGDLHPALAAKIIKVLSYVGNEAYITMFEHHTPHWRPDPDDGVRVFSSIDVIAGGTDPFCPLLLPFINRGY